MSAIFRTFNASGLLLALISLLRIYTGYCLLRVEEEGFCRLAPFCYGERGLDCDLVVWRTFCFVYRDAIDSV